MLEGYRPIDFSSLQSGNLGEVRNRVGLSQAAMGILANSQWNETPISMLLASGLNEKGEAPKRKQTLWGRFVDLLSSPAYQVANAADDALAGHQSSDTDSVLNDAKEIIGGGFMGGLRGAGTGLRGFAGDLIGMDPADPQDKIYLGDFLVRWDTHMSAEDAMKPENREEVRKRLEQKKINMFSDADEDKYFYDFDTGKVEVTDDDIQDYFEEMHLYGLGASIVGDPLNFVKGPAGVLGATAKNAEVPGEVITGSKNIFEGFKKSETPSVANTKVDFGPIGLGKSSGSYKVTLPPGAIQSRIANPATGDLVTPPGWFDFPANPAMAAPVAKAISQAEWDEAVKLYNHGDYGLPIEGLSTKFGTSPQAVHEIRQHLIRGTVPTLTSTRTISSAPEANTIDEMDDFIGKIEMGAHTRAKETVEKFVPTPRIPEEQIRIVRKFDSPKAINRLAGDLVRRAIMSGDDWANNMRGRLNKAFPAVSSKFTSTHKLIDHLASQANIPQRLAKPAQRKKMLGMLNRTIKMDIAAMSVPERVRPAGEVLNIANNLGPVHLSRLVAKAKGEDVIKPKNSARNSQVATETFNKFHDQILGKALPGGIKDPARYWASVNAGRTNRYSGPQQAQMWNHITHVLKDVKSPQRFAVANQILREVEQLFMSRGVRAMSDAPTKNSFPLRLSQVLDAIGPAAAAMSTTLLTRILRGDPKALSTLDAATIQKIEDIKAGEALVDGSRIAPIVEESTKRIEDLVKGPLSVARTEEIVTIQSKVAQDIAAKVGGSAVSGQMAKALTAANIIPKTPVDEAIKSKALNTNALISHPEVSPKLLAKYGSAPSVTRAIHQVIGGPSPRQAGKMRSAIAAKVPEWIGARFNAAYKNADMRPIYLKEAASAKATVARRAEFLNNLAKTFNVNDADLWNDALKGAQGRMEPVSGTQAYELSREITKIMENLFGSSGLKASVIADSTVVGRSQLFMKELNANLKRFGLGEFQFTKGKAKKGEPNPYGEGIGWLNSWENWKITDPLGFLFKIQNVVEHTVREKIMFDEIAARFGTVNRGGEFTQKVNHPRLGHLYFGPEAASQINQFVKNLREISKTSNKQLQMYDKVVSKWKAGVTIYIPSHHVRNLIGDTYFNWMAGVNDIGVYGTSMKVMQAQKKRYQGLEGIDALTTPEALKKALATGGTTAGTSIQRAKGKNVALTMKNGEKITNDMVYISAFQQGILPTTRVLEDIPDDAATFMERFKPLGGRGQKVAHHISEGRDHYIRLAHYIDQLKKSNKSFEKASVDAAAQVRKWHPDGMDLTAFERNVMRRMFPFYSWTRKAIPLIIESMVATPGKVMAIPKAQYLAQNLMGIQTGPMSDPFPVDQIFPDWIREKGVGPIAGPDSMLTDILGGEAGYSVVNPGTPTTDIIAQLNHPGKMGVGMLTPAARIPYELATGVEAQTGAPIEGVTDTDYMVKQVPGLSHAGRLTGEFGVSDTTKQNSNIVNIQNLINMLSAAGAQNTGPYQKSAAFDIREFLRSQNGG